MLYIAQVFGVALTLARGADRRHLGAGRRDAAGSHEAGRIQGRRAHSRIVRHPIYLGWVLMVFATPVMTTTRLLFAVISTPISIAAIPFEERSLVEASRRKYGAYQQQMRWRLIPFVW